MSEITIVAIVAVVAITVVMVLLLRQSSEPAKRLDASDDGGGPKAEEKGDSSAEREEARGEDTSSAQAATTATKASKERPAATDTSKADKATFEPATKASKESQKSSEVAAKESRDSKPSSATSSSSQPASATISSTPPSASTSDRPSMRPSLRPSTPAAEDAFSAFKRGLSSTRGGFISKLGKLFKGKPEIDEGLFSQMEEILIAADIGSTTATTVLKSVRDKIKGESGLDSQTVWDALRAEVLEILRTDSAALSLTHQPSLILVTGVNGAGKTTTIGKLAQRYKSEGKRVLLAAGDTYRAAAVLQLEVWGQRVGCPVVKGKEGADPGSVIFEAITRGREEGYDLVIADTAGRLHTKQPLMDELKKVDRTITKALGGRPADEILLVLDATTGQNAVQQMHMFREALNITGVVLTKLDGTAKGGVILGIVSEHKVPVRFVGLGERVEDLREFEAEEFVRALFEQSNDENLAA